MAASSKNSAITIPRSKDPAKQFVAKLDRCRYWLDIGRDTVGNGFVAAEKERRRSQAPAAAQAGQAQTRPGPAEDEAKTAATPAATPAAKPEVKAEVKPEPKPEPKPEVKAEEKKKPPPPRSLLPAIDLFLEPRP